MERRGTEFTRDRINRHLHERVSRRTMLARGVALGLGVPVASTLVAACAETDDVDTDDDVAAVEEDDELDDLEADDDDVDDELDDLEADDDDVDDEPGEVTEGGTARAAIAELGSDAEVVLNAVIANIAPQQSQALLHYGGLVKLGAESQLIPDLADDYEVSEDALEIRFELLEDAEWSDGEPFTADDVVFTFELIANPETGAGRHAPFVAEVLGASEFAAGEADSIEGVSTPDDKTVVIELSEPNAIWLQQFNGNAGQAILPKHIWEDIEPSEIEGHDLSRSPEVGAGPFLFSRWESEQFLEFTANENYARGAPMLDSLLLMLVTAEAAVAQIEAGELDVSEIPHGERSRMEDLEGIAVDTKPSVTPAYLVVNTAQPFLTVPVRQAMMYAIDTDAIIESAYDGNATPMYSHFFGEWDVTEEADLNTYDYDPDRARGLLEEEGWDENQVVELIMPTAMAVHSPAWTMIQAYLRDVGINLELREMEFAALRELRADEDPLLFDMHTGYGGTLGADPGGLILGISRPSPADGSPNVERYENPELEEVAREALMTADREERREIYVRAAQILNEELPWIYLFAPDAVVARNERLNGFELSSLGRNMVWNAHEWRISD